MSIVKRFLNTALDAARSRGAATWSARGALCALAAALSTIGGAPEARGCGGTPPPPACGYTLNISKAAPGPLLLTGGGTFVLPVIVYFRVQEWPIGSGACPTPPHFISVTAKVNCVGGPGAIGGASFVVTSQRAFVIVPLSITIPPGPARLCFISGAATATLSNGVVLTATGDTAVCIVDPSPSDPSVPRLDLQHLTPEIQSAHPGDHGRFMFRVTNNDPVETFTGLMTADSNQTSRLPTQTGGPTLPDTGVFAVSEPLSGDNFPIAWGDQMTDPCLPLPGNPADPTVPSIARPLVLGPGESQDIELVTRSWGMCADGSCSENVVILEGTFSDGVNGFACAGVAFVADSDVMPTYECDDGGKVTKHTPLPPVRTIADGSPSPDNHWRIDTEIVPLQLFTNGVPMPFPPNVLTAGMTDEYTRHGVLMQVNPPALYVDSFFDITYHIDFVPHVGPGGAKAVTLDNFFFPPGTPNGFADRAPLAMGTSSATSINDHGFAVDSFFDITYQISFAARTIEGGFLPLRAENIVAEQTGPNTVHVSARLRPLFDASEGDPLVPINAVRIFHDVRGFARPSAAIVCPGDTNGDNVVDFADFSTVLAQYGLSGPGLAGDLNGDGVVDFTDFSEVLANYGNTCS